MDPIDAALRSSPDWVESLRQRHAQDPTSVDATWAAFFSGYDRGLADGAREAAAACEATGASALGVLAERGLPAGLDRRRVPPAARIFDLVHSYRAYGHLAADLDPLGRSPREHPLLDLARIGFTEHELDETVTCETFTGLPEATVREYLHALRETYAGSIGVEFVDVTDKDQKDWLQQRMESVRNRPALTAGLQRRILEGLVAADTFEESLHSMYRTVKRFSLEGGTSLITLLDTVVEASVDANVVNLVFGMAHRGRLNVLANVIGKPLDFIFAEFEGRPLPSEVQDYGDVKYHLGFSNDREVRSGQRIHLSLEFNPSHLEAVNPVVEGIVRAKQNRIGDTQRRRVIPVLIHGDAAFPGQGIVAETFLLSDLDAYDTGGTIHVVINNQVGFTTDPAEGRSARYCTEIAKVARAPVFHVNGDDPEAVRWVAQLAFDFRQNFGEDVVIDLTCYRRHGHNELDDPTFTQPVLYSLIKAHPTNSARYARQLEERGVIAAGEAEAMAEGVRVQIERARERGRNHERLHIDRLGGAWTGLGPAGDDWTADTAVERATLERIARSLVSVPDGFNWHPRLEKLMRERAAMILDSGAIDWGCAEAMAVGSLLLEGTKVRLTGQDTQRGTFSHRHAVYSDHQTGERYVPLNHVADAQNRFQVFNSPLSEAAVLGFEYGYSTADPWSLVAWEAQFGDFVNGAQVIIDQLIASCEYKWGRMSGLVLLLPHGYEGQGPEHSSARLERFLELCAENNMQVCNPTTPAQYFHLLRRQMHRNFRKPLVVLTPKYLLRHARATSRVEDLTAGQFQPLLGDAGIHDPASVRRVLACSGKVAVRLLEAREQRGLGNVAILRLEQLYPFPAADWAARLASYPGLESVVWVQEEPRNMGAWRNLLHRFKAGIPEGVPLSYAGRQSAAVPATGSYDVHQREEAAFVEAAFAGLQTAATSPRGGTDRRKAGS